MNICISYADVIRTASLVVAIIGAFLVVRQLRLAREGQEIDHLRRKNEATLDAFNSVRDEIRRLDDELCEFLEINFSGEMKEGDVGKIMQKPEKRASLRALLHYFSRFAAGVKHDIYNRKVFYDLNGVFFIMMYKRYLPYIKEIQKKEPSFYVEMCCFFEKLDVE